MIKKIHIQEDRIKPLLNEYITEKCYHFCSKEALISILNSNRFILRTNVVSKSEHWYEPNRRFFMSVTRNKHPFEGYSSLLLSDTVYARIELDGNALNMNYRGRPINYFARGSEGLIYGAPVERGMYKSQKADITHGYVNKSNTAVENEDRIFSSRPYIPNASKYIKRIDVIVQCLKKDFGESVYYLLIDIDPSWYPLIHFYDSVRGLIEGKERKVVFPTQNKDNVDRRRRALDNDFAYVGGEVSKPITCTLLECGLLKAVIEISRNDKTSSPKEFTYSIAKRYNIPIIEQDKEAETRNGFSVNADAQYIHCEKLYKRLINNEWDQALQYDISRLTSRLEYDIKNLNTTLLKHNAALTAVKAITDTFRKLGVETISQDVQGRDVKGNEIIPLKYQLNGRFSKNEPNDADDFLPW